MVPLYPPWSSCAAERFIDEAFAVASDIGVPEAPGTYGAVLFFILARL
jgi:hypothetical protein